MGWSCPFSFCAIPVQKQLITQQFEVEKVRKSLTFKTPGLSPLQMCNRHQNAAGFGKPMRFSPFRPQCPHSPLICLACAHSTITLLWHLGAVHLSGVFSFWSRCVENYTLDNILAIQRQDMQNLMKVGWAQWTHLQHVCK